MTKRILNIVLIFITAVAVLGSCLLLYFKTIGKDKLPTAIASTYATTVTDPQTGEEIPVLEANYYANKNNTGREVIEFRINSYSGVSKQAIYSRGFQIVWDENGKIIQYTDPTTNEKSNVWYYDSYDNISFETGHKYKFGDKMVIDINGETYGVALDGTYKITTKKFSVAKAIGHTITGFFTGYDYKTQAYHFETKKYEYTFEDLLIKIKNIIKSSSNSTGQSVIPLIDLADFLGIYEYDENSGQFGERVGGTTKNVLTNNYFTMATNYNKRGMAWSKQSLFGSVAGDSEYNKTGLLEQVDYWKATTQYTLTEQDFVSRYSKVEDGFYYALPTELINELKIYKNCEINIVFNVSNFDLNVLGFDYYALNGIKVSTLTIKSNTQRNFNLLVGSLKDTGLTSADITLSNINLVNTNSGVAL